MGIERRGGRTAYYRKRWRRGRVVSEYVASGDLGELAYALDLLERRQKQAERTELRQQQALLAEPRPMRLYRQLLTCLVCAAIEACGYHQHQRGAWRKRRMQSEQEALDATAMQRLWDRAARKGAAAADVQALRDAIVTYGDVDQLFSLYGVAERALIDALSDDRVNRAISTGHVQRLRHELGGENPTIIERLLIDQVILSYVHLNHVELQHSKLQGLDATITLTEFLEQRLSVSQARYLRAIEALARVRRLMGLPGPQININMPGGQQLNVAGDVQVS